MTYISLLSDASLALFPQNTISSFRVKLPQPLQVNRDQYQVGLSSIEWPHRFNNVQDGTFKVKIKPRPKRPRGPGKPPRRELVRFKIAGGHYKTVDYLIEVINEKLKNLKFRSAGNQGTLNGTQHCRFIYNNTSGKVEFECAPTSPGIVTVTLPRSLHIKLGFSMGKEVNPVVKGGDIGPHTVDLNAGVNGLFVYCDVVENRVVGDVVAPLLKIIPVQGTHGDIIHYEPTRIEYCDLRYDQLDEIKIDIRTETGQYAAFLSGKTLVTLHIKRRGL